MGNQEIYHKIKTIVHSYIPDAQVLLFGSRAKGTMDEDSDYDLLVVVNNKLSQTEKMDYQSKIRKALVWFFDVPFDIILKDTIEIERYKNAKGHIIYYALNDAIEI